MTHCEPLSRVVLKVTEKTQVGLLSLNAPLVATVIIRYNSDCACGCMRLATANYGRLYSPTDSQLKHTKM